MANVPAHIKSLCSHFIGQVVQVISGLMNAQEASRKVDWLVVEFVSEGDVVVILHVPDLVDGIYIIYEKIT